VNFAKGTDKTVLNQVVGGDDIARQGSRVTRQTRDKCFELIIEVSVFPVRSPGSLGTRTTVLTVMLTRAGSRQIHIRHQGVATRCIRAFRQRSVQMMRRTS